MPALDMPRAPLLHSLLDTAKYQGASDIHIEPASQHVRIRLRKNGTLYTWKYVPCAQGEQLLSSIKILAKLDIAEKRLPQDGQFQYTYPSNHCATEQCNMRVNTCPSLWGEKMVLRMLQTHHTPLSLSDLGMPASLYHGVRMLLEEPHGLILLAGPTGSGKTTTLYAMLRATNTEEQHVVSIEDPIEVPLEGVMQIPIQPQLGWDFSQALRNILRHDPDIIMIGEIRDTLTAQAAIGAAETGHLVLSTVHAANAAGVLPRLRHLGTSSFQYKRHVRAVIAQRLVRLLCPHCKIPADPEDAIPSFQANPMGCNQCQNGYRGRQGIFEWLQLPTPITASAPFEATNLRTEAERLCANGLISASEIIRVLGRYPLYG